MRGLLAFITISLLAFGPGCGLVSVFSSPTRYEREIPAEYDLASEKGKILAVVGQAGWVNIPVDLKTKLTAALNKSLAERLGLKQKQIIDNEKTRDFLEPEDKAGGFSPYSIGKKSGAAFVLYVELDDFNMTRVTETNYLKADVSGKVALYDIEAEKKVWPETEPAKLIRVGFDIEQGGYQAVTTRLAGSFAHCTTRYLYDCPVAKFKHFDDASINDWDPWSQ